MVTGARRSHRTSLSEFAHVAGFDAFSTVVSAHSHSHHSREALADVPTYISRVPFVGWRFVRELRGCLDREGCPADYTNVWWHPPVSPRDLFESEIGQIEERFGLDGLVSVTDHDAITAGEELQQFFAARRAPISVEWTVPFNGTFFHLGVHNLPARDAQSWHRRLLRLADGGVEDSIQDALHDLHAVRDSLVVFNHPLWDLAGVGDRHTPLVRSFLDRHNPHVHAIELNGYRSWDENQQAQRLAEAYALPAIAGGDRHGLEPNRLLNVSFATSFAEFAAEVRAGISHVVIMPEYRTSLAARILASASDVFRATRARGGEERWTDRISWEVGDSARRLSSRWPNGGSFWVRSAVATFNVLSHPLMRPVTRSALLASDGALARTAVHPSEWDAPRRRLGQESDQRCSAG